MMRCEENFVKMDTNNDGKVSLAEFSAVKHPRGNAEELFKERDADKDGLLTKEEFCSQGAMRGNRRGKGN
jgi:Ca2+-binding EF-hand superfamily protein